MTERTERDEIVSVCRRRASELAESAVVCEQQGLYARADRHRSYSKHFEAAAAYIEELESNGVGPTLLAIIGEQAQRSAERRVQIESEVESLRTANAALEAALKSERTCGDCSEPIRPACRCVEHVRETELLGKVAERDAEVAPVEQECRELLSILYPDKPNDLSILAMVKLFGAYAGEFEQALEKGLAAIAPGTKAAGTVRENLEQVFEQLLELKAQAHPAADVVERAEQAMKANGCVTIEYDNEFSSDFIVSVAPTAGAYMHPTLIAALRALAGEVEGG